MSNLADEITQTAAELKALLTSLVNHDKHPVVLRRIDALLLLKSGQCQDLNEVCKVMGYSHATAKRIWWRYQKFGLEDLLKPVRKISLFETDKPAEHNRCEGLSVRQTESMFLELSRWCRHHELSYSLGGRTKKWAVELTLAGLKELSANPLQYSVKVVATPIDKPVDSTVTGSSFMLPMTPGQRLAADMLRLPAESDGALSRRIVYAALKASGMGETVTAKPFERYQCKSLN